MKLPRTRRKRHRNQQPASTASIIKRIEKRENDDASSGRGREKEKGCGCGCGCSISVVAVVEEKKLRPLSVARALAPLFFSRKQPSRVSSSISNIHENQGQKNRIRTSMRAREKTKMVAVAVAAAAPSSPSPSLSPLLKQKNANSSFPLPTLSISSPSLFHSLNLKNSQSLHSKRRKIAKPRRLRTKK